MQLPWFLSFLFSLMVPALALVGGGAVLGYIIVKAAGSLPAMLTAPVRKRLLRMGVTMGGGTQMLIQDDDGVLQLADAEYDAENGGYWADVGGGREFFSSEGKGGAPKWFYGATVVLAYDGLGATSDLVSAEIGRQAQVKKQVAKEPGRLADAYEQLVGAKERLAGDVLDADAVTDGGVPKPEVVDEWKAYLPKRAVVDLRDTLHNAPFHVRPAQFHRVEENAKAGQSGGLNPTVADLGKVGLGFMMAVIGYYIFAGGGGGAAVSLPF
jgi:hypothetical protein